MFVSSYACGVQPRHSLRIESFFLMNRLPYMYMYISQCTIRREVITSLADCTESTSYRRSALMVEAIKLAYSVFHGRDGLRAAW